MRPNGVRCWGPHSIGVMTMVSGRRPREMSVVDPLKRERTEVSASINPRWMQGCRTRQVLGQGRVVNLRLELVGTTVTMIS